MRSLPSFRVLLCTLRCASAGVCQPVRLCVPVGYRLRVDSALPHATQPQRAAFVSSFATSPHFLKLQERRSSAGMHLERLSNSGASRRPSDRRLSYVSPYRNSSNSVLPYSEPEKG